MKTLTLLRHGKSIRSDDYPVDYDRPLAKRGFKDSARVLKVLRKISPPVDWIVSSPARRARQTAEVVAPGLGLADQIIWDEDVYEYGAETMLELLKETSVEIEHILVVGHNPTLELMVSGLCAGTAGYMENSLPTAGFANLELQIMRWDQLRWGCGTLRLYIRPRLLKGL